jgi:hypothetical protein
VIVSLSENCPLLRESDAVHLAHLLSTVVTGQNLLAAPSPERLDMIAPPAVWAIYREHVVQSYKNAVNSPQYWSKHSDCGACKPESVSRFYALPTLIIVENLTTDGRWLLLVCTLLRPRLRRALAGATRYVHIEQAGGNGEIPKVVRHRAAHYASLRPAGEIPLKVVVFTDSDAKAPDAISSGAREVNSAATEVGAAVHVTVKRTIENYVPDEALRSYVATRRDRSAAAHWISSLHPPARDHYPIKDGLDRQELDAAGDLYPDGTPCRLGMGDFIADLLEHFAHEVTGHGLRHRDGVAELEQLLNLVEGNL